MRLYKKKQLELIKYASKDTEMRHALTGLHIDRDTATITDGHKLISVTSQPQPQEDWPANGIPWEKNSAPFVMPKELVEKALKNMPKLRKHEQNEIINNVAIGHKKDGGLVCQTTDHANPEHANTEHIEGRAINPEEHKYPDFKQVIPDYKNPDLYARISVSAKYLKEISTLFEKYNDTNSAVILFVRKSYTPTSEKDETKPEDFSMVITAIAPDDTKGLAVIMPLRM